MMKDRAIQKSQITMRVLSQQKYAMINREELRTSVMDRSSNYRLKVEDDNLIQFHSNKTKFNDWSYTLRDGKIPKSLQSAMKVPSHKKLVEDDETQETKSPLDN